MQNLRFFSLLTEFWESGTGIRQISHPPKFRPLFNGDERAYLNYVSRSRMGPLDRSVGGR